MRLPFQLKMSEGLRVLMTDDVRHANAHRHIAAPM
jgi:hypothetical protein